MAHKDPTTTEFNTTALSMILPLDHHPANTLVSPPFKAFTDDLTAICGVSEDCHKEVNYDLELYSCHTCNDPIACDKSTDT